METQNREASKYPVSALAVLGFFLALGFSPATPVMKAYADPPPWASAYGHRKNEVKVHTARSEHSEEATILAPAPVLTVRCNREFADGIVGGIVGGLRGSNAADGHRADTTAGSVAGVLVGRHLGQHIDATDRRCTGQVLENVEDNQPVAWRDPDSNADYTVTPFNTFQNDSGSYCREYQTRIIADGYIEKDYGMACRVNEGTWQIVSL